MNDAEFKRLDLSKLGTLSNGERSKLLQAMTAAQQKHAIAAITAAYVAGTGAATPKPAATISADLIARTYAKRARESAAGHVTAKQTSANGGPVFGSKAFADAVYAKRGQASGAEHTAGAD